MWAIGSIVLIILYGVDLNRFTRYLHGVPELSLIFFITPFVFVGGVFLWSLFNDWLGLRRRQHLLVTWLWMVLSTLSALKIAVGYGLMDNASGAYLATGSLQVWIRDVPSVLLNPAAQARFLHLLGASYLTTATLVLSASAWYLRRGRNVQIARRSMTVAASFGVAAALSLAVLGDSNGYAGSPGQQMRIAAIAAEWHTQPAPAPFVVFGLPDPDSRETRAALRIPWVQGLGMTHSWREPVVGLDQLETANVSRIRRGLTEFIALDTKRAPLREATVDTTLAGADPDLGYGLLLLSHVQTPLQQDGDEIAAVARDTIPNVPLLF
ncbi:cytochrome ubiquinol oxidase subunit I [Rhodanobacter sp. DHG33]|nr:cytochrome ubiquinol oxidase subunit I [Rhodanobacter sp. DHG33]